MYFENEVRDCVDRIDRIFLDRQEPTSEKIKLIIQVFDYLSDMATASINHARHNPGFISDAILRTQLIMDVMGDDDFSGSPHIVQQGLLDQFSNAVVNMWKPLSDHRDRKLAALRLSLEAMLEREAQFVPIVR